VVRLAGGELPKLKRGFDRVRLRLSDRLAALIPDPSPASAGEGSTALPDLMVDPMCYDSPFLIAEHTTLAEPVEANSQNHCKQTLASIGLVGAIAKPQPTTTRTL